MKEKILITTSSFGEKDDTPIMMLQNEGFEVVNNPYKRKVTKEELIALLGLEVIGLIAGLETIDEEVLTHSNLKCISRVGAGISNIDLEAAARLNIKVDNTPDGPTQAVAELTVGALLNLLRPLIFMNSELHQGRWEKRIGYQLEGKCCLIIGYGRIGKKVSNILNAFGAKILIYDPYVENVDGFPKVDLLSDGLEMANIISIHSSGEKCILDANEFSKMKKGVFLLNAARGTLIDETALINALNNQIVAGAWLDTFSCEPYTGELTKYSNVILTPHVGSYTKECRLQMELDAVKNLIKSIKK